MIASHSQSSLVSPSHLSGIVNHFKAQIVLSRVSNCQLGTQLIMMLNTGGLWWVSFVQDDQPFKMINYFGEWTIAHFHKPLDSLQLISYNPKILRMYHLNPFNICILDIYFTNITRCSASVRAKVPRPRSSSGRRSWRSAWSVAPRPGPPSAPRRWRPSPRGASARPWGCGNTRGCQGPRNSLGRARKAGSQDGLGRFFERI